MTNYGIPQPVRTAWHEAGHCIAGVVLGHQPGPVTVIPNDARNGCAFHRWDGVDLGDVPGWFERPVVLWPATVRQLFETNAMIAMAGKVAEELIPGDAADVDSFAYEAHAYPDHPWPGPTGLTAAEQHDLAADAALLPEEVRHDPETAAEYAWLCFGTAERRAWRWGRWLHEETRAILRGNVAKVERLARALAEHRTLSGADVRALVAGDPRGIHHR